MKQLSFIDPVPSSATPHGLREQPHKAEQKRRESLRDALLDYMRARTGQWLPNHELCEVGGMRAVGARLCEIRKEWVIEKRHVKGGSWEFRLMGRKEW
jgi:hypothetical protein